MLGLWHAHCILRGWAAAVGREEFPGTQIFQIKVEDFKMAIQKKSLISSTPKKSTSNLPQVGGNPGITRVAHTKVAATKVAATKVAATKVAATRVAATKVAATRVAATKVAVTRVKI
jgi:hypothetical protein